MTIIENHQRHQAIGDTIEHAAAVCSGWFDDPAGQHRLRFFDGENWTDHVTHFGPAPCYGCG